MLSTKQLLIHKPETLSISKLLKIIVLVFIGLSSQSFYSQNFPSNDICETSTLISTEGLCGSLVLDGSTIWGLPDESVNTCSDKTIIAPGVWYKLSDYEGDLNIIANGQDGFDPSLSVFYGSCNALQCLNYNDDAKCHLSTAMVDIIADSELDYYVHVSGFGSTVGDFTLHFNANPCTTPPPITTLLENFEGTANTIFPNPVEMQLTVVIDKIWPVSTRQLEVKVLNTLGQVIQKETRSNLAPSITLDVQSIQHGMYYLQISDPNSKEKIVAPFFKK